MEVRRLASSLLLLLATWLWYLGTPTETLLRALLVLGLQTLLGWQLLRLITRPSTLGAPGAVGISASFGAIAIVVLDQAIRLVTTSWLRDAVLISAILVAITVLTIATSKIQSTQLVTTTQVFDRGAVSESGLVTIVGAFTLFVARGQVSSGRLIAAAVLIVGAVVVLKLTSSGHRLESIVALAISLSSIALASLLRPRVSSIEWKLEPLYFGSDDLIFSEALSFSVSNSGPTEHIAAYGSSLRYHWLSLAWSGTLGRLTDAEPLISSLHLAPAFGYLTICLLVFGIVRQFTTSRMAPLLAALMLFMTNYPIVDNRLIVAENTSNVLGHIWLLSAILLVLLIYQSYSTVTVTALVITLMAIFMAKPHYITPIVIMVILTVLRAIKRRAAILLTLAVSLTSLFSLAMVYLLFLSPHEWEQRRVRLHAGWFGLPTTGVLRLFSPVLAIAVVSLLTAGPLLMLLGHGIRSSNSNRIGGLLAASVWIAGLSSLFITGNSSEQYVLGAALSVGAPLAGAVVAQLADNARIRGYVLGLVLILSLAGCWWLLSEWVHVTEVVGSRLNLKDPIPYSIQLLLPLGVVVCAGLFGLALHACSRPISGSLSDIPRLLRSRVLVCGMMSLIGLQIGAYLADVNYGNAQKQVAPPDDLEALQWIRENSDKSWRIATNRDLCIDPPHCTEGGSSFLVSALTRVPVLIEGPRFVVGGQKYPSWVLDRISASLEFAQSPSRTNAGRLTDLGVTHFYFDDASPPGIPTVADLADVGVVLYSQKNRLVLDLRP